MSKEYFNNNGAWEEIAKTNIIPSPSKQPNTFAVVKDLITNISGKVLPYEKVYVEGQYPYFEIKKNGASLTYVQAQEYMLSLVGSSYVTTYSLDNPYFAYILNANKEMFKAQYTSGMRWYVMGAIGPSVEKITFTEVGNDTYYLDLQTPIRIGNIEDGDIVSLTIRNGQALTGTGSLTAGCAADTNNYYIEGSLYDYEREMTVPISFKIDIDESGYIISNVFVGGENDFVFTADVNYTFKLKIMHMGD